MHVTTGYKCLPVFYNDENIEKVYNYCAQSDGIILRVNPGTYSGVTQKKLDFMIRDLAAKGIPAMSHPDVERAMGAADALVAVRGLSVGVADTFAYSDKQSLMKGLSSSLMQRPRLLKAARASDGKANEDGAGVWMVRRKDENYGAPLPWDSMVLVQEGVDNHVRTLTYCMTLYSYTISTSSLSSHCTHTLYRLHRYHRTVLIHYIASIAIIALYSYTISTPSLSSLRWVHYNIVLIHYIAFIAIIYHR
jgi:hypothetical protein